MRSVRRSEGVAMIETSEVEEPADNTRGNLARGFTVADTLDSRTKELLLELAKNCR